MRHGSLSKDQHFIAVAVEHFSHCGMRFTSLNIRQAHLQGCRDLFAGFTGYCIRQRCQFRKHVLRRCNNLVGQ